MSKVYLEDSILTGIGDAIRAKSGGSDLITPANMATEISNISSGGDSIISFPFRTYVNNYCYKGSESSSWFFIPLEKFQGKNNIKIKYTLRVPAQYPTYRNFSLTLMSVYFQISKNSLELFDNIASIFSNYETTNKIEDEYIYTIDDTKDYQKGLALVSDITDKTNFSTSSISHSININSVEVS